MNEDIIPKWVIDGGYKISFDKFYTSEQCVKHCLDVIESIVGVDVLNSCSILEPSAGNGSFYKELCSRYNEVIGLDIAPECNSVIEQDFFEWQPDRNKQYITIGNPPFGVRGWMALEFINKAAEFSDYVCFILPMYFSSDGKGSAKFRVKGLELIYSEDLEYPFNDVELNKEVQLNTVFQIWKRGINKSFFIPESENVSVYTVCSNPNRRCGMDKLDEYDCFISSTFYTTNNVVYNFDDVKYNAGYGIIIHDTDKKEEILNFLNDTDWSKYNIKATNKCRHINKNHIIQRVNEFYSNTKSSESNIEDFF